MSKNKKIVVSVVAIIVVIAIVAAGVYAYLRHQQVKQYNAVMTEVEMINDITSQDYTGNIDREELNALLERRVASGEYGQVETAFKNYMTDLYAIVYDTTDTAKSAAPSSYLAADNIEKDGPEFETSKKSADDIIAKLQEEKESYTEMLNADAVSSYAERMGLEGKYLDLYNQILSDHTNTDTSENNKFITSIDTATTKLTAAKDAMNFLSEHKDAWSLKDEKITFTDESLYTEYSNIIAKV